jgi:tetratricopeptide (TPR) repeat protein
LFPPPADAEFAKAAELHRRGDLLEAERACRRTLEHAPRHFGARYLLGIIALQRGAFADAERSIGLALAVNPNAASAHRHHGVALFRIGRPEDALASFTKALALNQDDAESFGLRGNVLHELGRFEEALSDHDSALALKPELAVSHNNRGLALRSLDRLDQALASIERAIALNPDYAAAHKNRGDVLRAMKRQADALVSYDRAIAVNPDFARAFHDRGIALAELGRPLDAIASYDEAIARDPKLAASFNNRGNVLQDLERFEDALESYDAAIAASPVLAEGWYNRGVVLLELKRPADALASHAHALALRPDYPEAHVARGFCKLAMGLFDTGWRDFENRWRVKTYPPLRAPTDASLWSGEDLRDRSIVVCSERGFGDIVQFSRFVPLLAERGAQVTFLVPEKLRRILAAMPETVRVISTVAGEDRFDFHCALMSLPCWLEVTPADNPLPIPYLAIDAERAAEWKQRIGERGFKIGISWRGALWQGGAAIIGRAIPLSVFQALSQIEGVRLISLQKGHGVEQLASLPPSMPVETLGEDFDAGPDAFIDTIAVMEHLDLIVTCDTSIAHVAGARGRPTWIALKHVPEWRWGLEGKTTPWYPTARLFRQKTRGDWGGVFAEMASELKTLVR